MATATDGTGIDEVADAIERHRTSAGASNTLAAKRQARLLREVETLAAERFRLRASAVLATGSLADDLATRRMDPYRAAAMLVDEAARVKADPA
jgi:LAO/AO transport system kinase